MQDSKQRELQGWDEIADYVGMGRRTAQKYEAEHGLPVHRLPGARSRVYASPAELDAWKTRLTESEAVPASEDSASESPLPPSSLAAAPQLPSEPSVPVRTDRARHVLGIVVSLMLAGVLVLYLLGRTNRPSGPPTELGFKRNTLIAYNASGKELWRHGFPVAFHDVYNNPETLPRYTWIGDIDGDGQTEVLFLYQSVKDIEIGIPLICFSESGQIKWQFVAGREVYLDNEHFSGIYFSSLTVLPKRKQIVVSSNHSISDPQQIALLDGRGKLLGEYWHFGHLRDVAVTDLSGSGIERDLLMPGVDQALGQAELIVLPVDHFPPPLTAPGPFDLRSLAARDGETAIVMFPRSCITQRMEPFNIAFQIKVVPPSIEVFVYEGHKEGSAPLLIYTLNPKLEVIRLTVSGNFLARHKQLEADGILQHSFSKTEFEELRNGVVVNRR